MMIEKQFRLEAIANFAPCEFCPTPPEVPAGRHGHWVVSSIMPMNHHREVLVVWSWSENYDTYDELKQTKEMLLCVYDWIRFFEEKEEPDRWAKATAGEPHIHAILARLLVLAGVRKRLLPQHVERYVEDLDGEW